MSSNINLDSIDLNPSVIEILKNNQIQEIDFLLWLNKKYIVRMVGSGICVSIAITAGLAAFFVDAFINENPTNDIMWLLIGFVIVLWVSIVLPILWCAAISPWKKFISNPDIVYFDSSFLQYYSDPIRLLKFESKNWQEIHKVSEFLNMKF